MKTAKKENDKPTDTLAELARECLDKAHGDPTRAAELYEKHIRADRELFERVIGPYFKDQCRARIAALQSATRAALISPAGRDDEGKRRLTLLSNSHAMTLLDFPIFGGKRLGDATREEIEESARRYSIAAEDMSIKAAWQARIAEGLKPGEQAAKRYSVDDLQRLLDEVQS